MKPIPFEKVSIADAAQAHDEEPPATQSEWSSLRLTNDHDQPLREATAAWMAELPAEERPLQLALLFPRIANKICATWKHPFRCDDFMAELIIDRRGKRQGFPPDVAKEIGKLSVYRATLRPPGRPWLPPR